MRTALLIAAACTLTPAAAQTFSPEQIKKGAEVFTTNCVPCHGERMNDPTLFNLREFPKDQRARFINSVSNGKNAMPPWRGQLQSDEIEALWSYVSAGEKNH